MANTVEITGVLNHPGFKYLAMLNQIVLTVIIFVDKISAFKSIAYLIRNFYKHIVNKTENTAKADIRGC